MTETVIKKQNIALENLIDELKDIKEYLKKFLLLIPEESLKDYKNSSQVKKHYLDAVKLYSPTK
jgi:hypothetical protein